MTQMATIINREQLCYAQFQQFCIFLWLYSTANWFESNASWVLNNPKYVLNIIFAPSAIQVWSRSAKTNVAFKHYWRLWSNIFCVSSSVHPRNLSLCTSWGPFSVSSHDCISDHSIQHHIAQNYVFDNHLRWLSTVSKYIKHCFQQFHY